MDDHALDIDEFAGLAAEAAEFTIAVADTPLVRRADTHTSDGLVSSLLWGDEAPQVVLLHGAALNAHTWDATVLALGRPALAVDLPGHGHSAWRADGRYDPRRLAPTVATVIEQLAPDAELVVGQSLGGLVTVALGDLRDDVVRGQVLVDAAPALPGPGAGRVADFLGGPDSYAARDEIVERARAFGFGASREAVERAVVLNTVRRPDGRIVWRHHLGQQPGTVTSLGDPSALWPSLEAFRGPVTVVRAERGLLTDQQAAEVARRLPHAEVVTVATGHNVQEDDPVALARIIADRLED